MSPKRSAIGRSEGISRRQVLIGTVALGAASAMRTAHAQVPTSGGLPFQTNGRHGGDSASGCRVVPPTFNDPSGDGDNIRARVSQAASLRRSRATANRESSLADNGGDGHNLCNGDDIVFDHPDRPFIGSYSKGLDHNTVTGEVAYGNYRTLLFGLTNADRLPDGQTETRVDEFDTILEPALGTLRPSFRELLSAVAADPSAATAFPELQRYLGGTLNLPPTNGLLSLLQAQVNEGGAEAQVPAFRRQLTVQQGIAGPVIDKATGESGFRLVLENPLASNSFGLSGQDSHGIRVFRFHPDRTVDLFDFPPPPRFREPAELAEMAELYWMALLRDVPFTYYDDEENNPSDKGKALVTDALNDLNTNFSRYFQQPTHGGLGTDIALSGRQLFRGFTRGDRVGPYVSQFLIRPVPMGRVTLDPRLRTAAAREDLGGDPAFETDSGGQERRGQDYLIEFEDWLQRQNGFIGRAAINNVANPAFDRELRLLRTGRDGGEYVHADIVFQEFMHACFILFTPPDKRAASIPCTPCESPEPQEQESPSCPPPTPVGPSRLLDELDPGTVALPTAGGLFDPKVVLARDNPYSPRTDPYTSPGVQEGFVTLGAHDVKSMLGEVGKRALQAVWYQKWSLHRRLRPEELGGRIHVHISEEQGAQNRYTDRWSNEAFRRLQAGVLAENTPNRIPDSTGGSFLLPMAFPEACPMHPAYGQGHGTVAGACATLLKAFVNDEAALSEIMFVDPESQEEQQAFFAVEPDPTGRRLRRYTKEDANHLTIGGEIDKLASNEALFRNHAGVHWRSDYTYSLLLGQAVALSYLADVVNTYTENVTFSLRTFEDYRVGVFKTLNGKLEDSIRILDLPRPGSPELSGIYNPDYTSL